MASNNKEEALIASIVIPVKNGLPYLKDVLVALGKQKVDYAYQIVVIDSGSTDGSLELAKDDPNVILHEIKPSEYGHGKTRNLGASLTDSKYICFITHDAIPHNEHWLYELLLPFEKDADVAGVFGRHIAHECASILVASELDEHFNNLKQYPVIKITDARKYATNLGIRQLYHFYSDNSSAMRRSIWEKIPYPDVNFAEDQVWAKTIVEKGYKKAYAYDSIVRHSHEYSFIDTLRRSIDESRAFRHFFGYKVCNSLKHVLVNTKDKTKKDWRISQRDESNFTSYIKYIKIPLQNFLKNLGSYIGTKETLDNYNKLNTFLSVDKRKQKG